MNNTLITILLSLLINSCSSNNIERRPSSSISDKSCSSVMKSFLFSDYSWKAKVLNKVPFTKKAVLPLSDVTKESIYYWINISGLSTKKTVELHKQFSELPFNNEQFIKIMKKHGAFPKSNKKRDELFLYLSYANSFHAKKKELVIDDLKYVKSGRKKNSIYYKKFLESRSKFRTYEQKESKRIMFKLSKTTELSKKEIIKRARKEALFSRKEFESLSYACNAKVKTSANSLASKRFQKFALVVTPISTATMFTFANREDLKDALSEEDNEKILDWSKRLGYEIVLMSALNMVLSKIMSEPTGSYFSKVWKGAASDISLISADSVIYEKVFAASDSDLQEKYSKIKGSKDYNEMLADLERIVSRENTYQSYKNALFDSVKNIIGIESEDMNSKIDLSKVTKEEMDDPKVRDAILKAVTIQMYEEDKGTKDDALASLIHTGSKGEDRLFFFMEVAPIYHSINVGIGALIYSTICMGKNTPAKAFRNAALIYAGWSFSYNLFEFSARQHQIGQ